MNAPANFVSSPAQALVKHRDIDYIPVPITRWHAVKRDLKDISYAPWILQSLTSAFFGLALGSIAARFTNSVTPAQVESLNTATLICFALTLVTLVAVHHQRKKYFADIQGIVRAMDAVEEAYDVPACPGPESPTFGYRFRCAVQAFRSPP